jgi:hypothetical protein
VTGVVQRLFASHNIGRQMAIQRRQLRGRAASDRTISAARWSAARTIAVGLPTEGTSGAPQRGRFREELRKLNRSRRRKMSQYAKAA